VSGRDGNKDAAGLSGRPPTTGDLMPLININNKTIVDSRIYPVYNSQ